VSQPPQKPVLVFMENIYSLILSFFFSLFLVIHVTVQFSSVQSLSCVRLFAIPWFAARQASLSITNSQSSLRLTSIESVMSSSNLILLSPRCSVLRVQHKRSYDGNCSQRRSATMLLHKYFSAEEHTLNYI